MNDPESDRQRRFTALWQRLGGAQARAANGEQIHRELEALYALPARHYHTMRHISYCLATFDAHASLADDPDTVEAAIWFHDAVYEPGAPDNEARSAELFSARAGGVLDAARRDHVVDIIMATVHPCSPVHPDAKLMSDVDLSGFGLPRRAFLRDSTRVRRELCHLPLAEFWAGQRVFLDALLGQDAIYTTPPFHDRLEATARANIAAYREAMERRVAQGLVNGRGDVASPLGPAER